MRTKGTIVVLILTLSLVSGSVLFLALMCGERHTEIDVSSGRLRERVFLFGFMLSEKERETAFSRLVAKHVHEIPPPRYETAIVGDLRVIPLSRKHVCYDYGSAIGSMRLLPKMLEAWPSLRNKEGAIVIRMLEMLRQGNPKDMQPYLAELIPADSP